MLCAPLELLFVFAVFTGVLHLQLTTSYDGPTTCNLQPTYTPDIDQPETGGISIIVSVKPVKLFKYCSIVPQFANGWNGWVGNVLW